MAEELSGIDSLKENIIHERTIITEATSFINQLDMLENLKRSGYKINKEEQIIILNTLNSLLKQLRILNNSIPEIIRNLSSYKKLPRESESLTKDNKKLVSLQYESNKSHTSPSLTIRREDKESFLNELNLTESSIRRLKSGFKEKKEKDEEYQKPSDFAKFSNRLFSDVSNNLMEKNYFPNLNHELRKANIPFLTHTYVSMMLLASAISIIAALFLVIFFLFFNLSPDYPFLFLVKKSYLLRFVKIFWIILVVPVLTFFSMYYYPSSEKKYIANKINQELPFVTIHMSAIASSGIEPGKIFRIILLSKEYPNTKKEIKKLLNQVNLYGYDIVTALRNTARITSSPKLAELFNGLAITITSGGELKEFLDKRSETLIFDYKIEREKYTKMAEVFMNLYISIVIAAPMIMTILLVMMKIIPGFSIMGLGINALTFLMLLGVAMINVVFIVFLHLKQPKF